MAIESIERIATDIASAIAILGVPFALYRFFLHRRKPRTAFVLLIIVAGATGGIGLADAAFGVSLLSGVIAASSETAIVTAIAVASATTSVVSNIAVTRQEPERALALPGREPMPILSGKDHLPSLSAPIQPTPGTAPHQDAD